MIFTIGLALLVAGILTVIFIPTSLSERLSPDNMPQWKSLSLFIAWIAFACGCFLMLISMGILAVRYLP